MVPNYKHMSACTETDKIENTYMYILHTIMVPFIMKHIYQSYCTNTCKFIYVYCWAAEFRSLD